MTVSVKGDRLSTASAHHISIIDLNAETMTDVDLDKKTYAVITFAEFARAMQQMSEKMGEKTGDGSVNFKADVKQTGATRNHQRLPNQGNGSDARDGRAGQKSGEKGAMTVVTDMWLAPNLPGYEEVRSFLHADGPETCMDARYGRHGRDDGTSGRNDERHERDVQRKIEARGSSRASGCSHGRAGRRYERSRYGEDARGRTSSKSAATAASATSSVGGRCGRQCRNRRRIWAVWANWEGWPERPAALVDSAGRRSNSSRKNRNPNSRPKRRHRRHGAERPDRLQARHPPEP